MMLEEDKLGWNERICFIFFEITQFLSVNVNIA